MSLDVFFPCNDAQTMASMTAIWQHHPMTESLHFIVSEAFACTHPCPDGCHYIMGQSLWDTPTMQTIAANATTTYIALGLQAMPLLPGEHALKRMTDIAEAMNTTMVYADYREEVVSKDGSIFALHPLIDYQTGSIRDDFDFGQLVIINTEMLKLWAAENTDEHHQYAAWYSLRLFLSRKGLPLHVRECLYTAQKVDYRTSGERQFDYVDPRNRSVQIEMEQVATAHLGSIGALIDTAHLKDAGTDNDDFVCEASVIIPVFNREKTILDAIHSACAQQTTFKYNIIIVDNHSTDATTTLIRQAVGEQQAIEGAAPVVHLIPERTDLGIGGCWNHALLSTECGRYAIQLDSDDLYSSPHTLQRIVDTFHDTRAAMVIGSYGMYDFDLNTLPPGLIDHREWTDSNGPNNALRINGLGAPRAFYTPLARQLLFPNTSYGEDYAMALAVSRNYRIARIYDELYCCRRWTGNSDANLSQEKTNTNNSYKDQIRTIEIQKRKACHE